MGIGIRFRIIGYIRAEFAAGFPRVFLNAALAQGVELKQVRTQGSAIRFAVALRDYPKLRHAAKRAGGRLRALRKCGLPYLLRRHRNALPLAAGLCEMAVILALLGNLVFTVRITGNAALPRDQLLDALAENGVTVGGWQSSEDYAGVANNLMLRFDRLTWMAINPGYGVLEIELWDKIGRDDPLTGQSNAYLAAGKPAQIKRLRVVSGVAAVQPGEIVSAGQPLVLPDPNALAGSWAAAVQAEVTGYTVYTARFAVDGELAQNQPTGRTKRCWGVSAGGREAVYLPAPGCDFAEFETRVYTQPVYIFEVELPVRLAVTEFSETVREARRLTEQSARPLLLEQQRQFESQSLSGARILNRKNTFGFADGQFVLTTEYLCEESIGQYLPYAAQQPESPQ